MYGTEQTIKLTPTLLKRILDCPLAAFDAVMNDGSLQNPSDKTPNLRITKGLVTKSYHAFYPQQFRESSA